MNRASRSKGRVDVDAREFLPLHPLEARILLVLAEGESHGYAIVKQIEARDAGWAKIFPANLYRRLRDLLAKGLIEEADVSGDDGARGKRPFRITALGTTVARAEAERVQELAAAFGASGLVPGARGDR